MARKPLEMQKFIGLLTDHQEIIRSYVISLLPGCSEIRDIVQEANILLWEKRDTFEAGTNFGAWACTVAYYKVCEYRKRAKRDGILVFNEDLMDMISADSGERYPDEFEAKRTALAGCLEKLAPNDRNLLKLRYQSSSRGIDDLAEKTGRPNGSLRVTLCRLRSALKKCISARLAMERGLS